MVRMEPMAEASLPDMRARSRPGTAIAAMMPMIATTIRSSIRVKPSDFRIFIHSPWLRRLLPYELTGFLLRQPRYRGEFCTKAAKTRGNPCVYLLRYCHLPAHENK